MTCAPGVDCWEELKRIQAERAEQVRSHYEGKKVPLTPGEVPVESATLPEAVEAPVEVVVGAAEAPVEIENPIEVAEVEAPVEEKKAPKAKKKDAPVED
jgi:hypothetical protein